MSAPNVTVVASKYARSWPTYPVPPEKQDALVWIVPLEAALTQTFEVDAHFAAYEGPPELKRRLAKEAVAAGVHPVIGWDVFDVDCPEVHGTGKPAPDAWRRAIHARLDELEKAHPGIFAYDSAGGVRIIFRRVELFVVDTDDADQRWQREYLIRIAYLKRRFGIEADPSCKDWTRLYRLPRVVREMKDGTAQRQELPTRGNASEIGVLDFEPTEKDTKLAKKSDPKAFKPRQKIETEPSGARGILYYLLDGREDILGEHRDGALLIRCPNADEHTTGDDGDSSTILYPPAVGHRLGKIHCLHAHCTGLVARQWLAMFDEDELRDAQASADADDAPDWTRALQRSEDGAPLKLLANVLTVLAMHPAWQGVLAYDEFSDVVTKQKPPPVREQDGGAPELGEWTDEDTTAVAAWFATRIGFEPPAEHVQRAVARVARKRVVHPVRDWLRSLTWDGAPRLDRMLSTHFGAEDSEYARAVGACWMLSAVARVLRPGCKVDYLLILESEIQGKFKSESLRALTGDEWFADTGIEIGTKDSYQNLRGVWIYEFGELDAIKKSEVTRYKNFLSARTDRYRPSYGKNARTFPRQNVFAGTTNERHYLIDTTGNRRFWPVSCEHGANLDAIRRDRVQLWAEARVRFENGEKWWIEDARLEMLVREQQEIREVPDDWETIVAHWLSEQYKEWTRRRKVGLGKTKALPLPDPDPEDELDRVFRPIIPINPLEGVTTADVLLGALEFDADKITKAATMRAGTVLTKLGWEKRRPSTNPLVPRTPTGKRDRRYYPPLAWVAARNAKPSAA